MSASFILRLDTRAPVVTWGVYAGNIAGELLQVAYTIDEPAIESAEIELGDGRIVALDIYPDRVETLLPPDTPASPGTIRAFVSDDVGNAATRELVIPLDGTIVVPEPPPPYTGGVGAPPTRIERQAIRDRSTAVVTTRSRVRAMSHDSDTGTTRTRSTVRRRQLPVPPRIERPHVFFRDRSTAVGVTSARVTVRATGHSAGEMTGKSTIRRGDSPELELLILDL